MTSEQQIIIAFDLYGTLLSTESIAQELAKHFGKEKAQALAGLWRTLQLEYTWRLNSMNQYEPFSNITENSLHHALKQSCLELDEDSIKSVMDAYDSLSAFPDVERALDLVSKIPNLTAVVFSNGTDKMVGSSVKSSQDLGPHAAVFKHIVTVEEVKKFKPSPEVYYHLAEKVGKVKNKEEMGQMWLISGNPFDVVGCRAVGMQSAWVDRAGSGWTDQLVQDKIGQPTITGVDLGELVQAIIDRSS